MDVFEERLAEEVRRYKHLYDTTLPLFKTHDATLNSWGEMGTTLGCVPQVCLKMWKAICPDEEEDEAEKRASRQLEDYAFFHNALCLYKTLGH